MAHTVSRTRVCYIPLVQWRNEVLPWATAGTRLVVKETTVIGVKTVADEGLIPTNDDGPWHMLRRKGVP